MSFGTPRDVMPWTLDETPHSRSFARPWISASPSGTPPTSTEAGLPRKSSAARSTAHHPRGDRPRDQALLADARRTRWRWPVAKGDPGTGRRVPAPARNRLRRPAADPPLPSRCATRNSQPCQLCSRSGRSRRNCSQRTRTRHRSSPATSGPFGGLNVHRHPDTRTKTRWRFSISGRRLSARPTERARRHEAPSLTRRPAYG
jgi:hypothetical protein